MAAFYASVAINPEVKAGTCTVATGGDMKVTWTLGGGGSLKT